MFKIHQEVMMNKFIAKNLIIRIKMKLDQIKV